MQFWNRLKKAGFWTKEEKPEYFLVLILQETKAQTLAFEQLAGKVEILGTGSENLSSSIEEIEQEELLEACDRAIAMAEENLPPNISTSKTILGLKDNWVSDGKIKKEYSATLRKLKEDLELEFLGFIVITEAVCHLLQKEEGVPTTTLLIGKDGQFLTVALVRAGQLASLVIKKIEEKNWAQAVERVLRTFRDYEVLPSRMILFGEDRLEELQQELVSFPWTKALPFLHLPKIEILPEDFVGRAIITGFATQMGVEFTAEVEVKEKGELKEEVREAFGFVREKDIPEGEKLVSPPTQHLPSLGFLRKLPSFPRVKIPNLDFLDLKSRFVSKVRIPISLGGRDTALLVLLPILLLIFLVLGYLFLPRATITLYVSPKIFEKEQELVIDPTLSKTEIVTSKIRGYQVEIEVGDTLEKEATGKKETGEKTKGEVTIYNNSSQVISFTAGTVITGPNNLKFTLDEKMTVASASGDAISGTIPSKIKITVTAAQIGEESNFPSGTVFSIGSLTNVAAKNDNAFSGGTKKEVKVVSREDQETLNQTLLEKLISQAKERLTKEKEQEGQRIIEAAFSQETLEKKFSKKVDEEANNFSLFLKVKFKTLSFNEEELRGLFETQIKETEQDFVPDPDGVNLSFGRTRLNKDKSVSAQVSLRATLLPKIEEKKIKDSLRTKSLKAASQYLETISQISNYRIKVSPVFPFLAQRLPWRGENIRIEIKEK